jgi:hypothetical protein
MVFIKVPVIKLEVFPEDVLLPLARCKYLEIVGYHLYVL